VWHGSTGLDDGSKPLQVPFHQFAIFVADAGRMEHLGKTRRQTSVCIVHRRLRRDSLLILVHGSSLPPGTFAYSTYSTPQGLPITGE
jgi:hypothetical protein